MTIFAHYGREPGYPTCGDGINGGRYVGTYADRWLVRLNEGNESLLGEQILNALPSDFQLGGELGGFCRLTQRSLKRNGDARLLYYLDLTYTTDFNNQSASAFNVAPDQRPTKWGWDYEQYSAVIRKDADNGNPVVNSIGEPFEVVAEIALPILTVEKYQAFFDPDAIIENVNHRNFQTFWGAASGCVVCVGIRDRDGETYQGISYRLCSYTFKFFVPFIENVIEGATEIVLNCGHRYRPASGAEPVDARTLVNLAANGTKLPLTSDLIYKRFQKHPLANFDNLGVNIHQI